MTTLPPPREITGPGATAAIYDQGAHLVGWTPAGADPVLWLSPRTRLEEGTAIRGGVPICFPWFGPGRSGDRAPAHGTARVTPWTLVEQSEGRVRYEITGADLGVQDLVARYEVVAGSRLQLSLTVTNTGDDDLVYEEALHAYLAVGDVREVTVEGLDGASYVDKVDRGRTHTQAGELRFVAETDRVYRSACPVTVVDPVLGRRLRISTSGSASKVVWNPWAERAAAMADLGEDAWPGMLCVEGGNVLTDELTLTPGGSHLLRYSLEVLPL